MSYMEESLYESMSGTVKIWVPNYDNINAKPSEYNTVIRGILADDPQIMMENQFDTLSDLDNTLKDVQEFQQVMGGNGLVNYVPASAKTWQGTKAISIHLNFYLISFSSSSNIMRNLKKLAELATLRELGDTGTRFHGGYRMVLYEGNTFLSNTGMDKSQNVPGTCKININDTTQFQGMLLTKLNFNPSTVVCRKKEPLYYNVNADFVGYRAPLVGDLTSVFGGSR